MKQPVSNRIIFFRTLNLYGDWFLFEAIVESSTRPLEGDKLRYVLKVCSEKWKAAQLQQDENDDYAKSVKEAKERSAKKNLALARKLKGK